MTDETETVPRSLHDAEVGRLRKQLTAAYELLEAVWRLQRDMDKRHIRDLPGYVLDRVDNFSEALAALPNPDAVEGEKSG